MGEPQEDEAMRARGTGSVYQRTGRKPWWIKYYDRNGKAHYESSGSNSRSDAERLLKKRLGEISSGRRLVGATVERTTFEELERMIVDDYQLRRRKSLDSVLQSFRALRRHFGGWRAIDIGYAELTHYASQRLSECKPATVRRELVLLHRAFALGRGAEKVAQIPRFPLSVSTTLAAAFSSPTNGARSASTFPHTIKTPVTSPILPAGESWKCLRYDGRTSISKPGSFG
jgi:hypothetical protein